MELNTLHIYQKIGINVFLVKNTGTYYFAHLSKDWNKWLWLKILYSKRI